MICVQGGGGSGLALSGTFWLHYTLEGFYWDVREHGERNLRLSINERIEFVSALRIVDTRRVLFECFVMYSANSAYVVS